MNGATDGRSGAASGRTSGTSGRQTSGDPAVEAAGGVVLRTAGDDEQDVEVLVIHRVRYDDWSLPKGKLDPGEDAATAAVREVEEETGVRAELGGALDSVTYEVPAGPKLVHWFRMRPLGGDPSERAADGEVDVARWIPVTEAPSLLTYGHDLHVLAQALDDSEDPTP